MLRVDFTEECGCFLGVAFLVPKPRQTIDRVYLAAVRWLQAEDLLVRLGRILGAPQSFVQLGHVPKSILPVVRRTMVANKLLESLAGPFGLSQGPKHLPTKEQGFSRNFRVLCRFKKPGQRGLRRLVVGTPVLNPRQADRCSALPRVLCVPLDQLSIQGFGTIVLLGIEGCLGDLLGRIPPQRPNFRRIAEGFFVQSESFVGVAQLCMTNGRQRENLRTVRICRSRGQTG